MAAGHDVPLTLVMIARIPLDGIAAFQAYEDRVVPSLADHGGRLERRVRNDDGTLEVHVASFPTAQAFENYRSDPRRAAAGHLLDTSSAKIELISVSDVA